MRQKLFPVEGAVIVAHLHRAFQRAGHGSQARVTRALGLRDGHFSGWWSRPPKVPDAAKIFAALRVLGVDPGSFYAEIEPPAAGRELWEGPEPVEERATPTTRQAVEFACRRMRDELGLDIDLGNVAGGEAPAVRSVEASPDPGSALGAKWLEGLDQRRQTEPKAVIGELRDHLHQVEAAELPWALGIWGSALWAQIELETAAYLNLRALRLARAAGDDARVADLLLRRSYIIADAGDHDRALALTALAAGTFDGIDDQAGRGRALVDRGQFLYYLGRLQEADAAAGRALELLPDSLPQNRFAAYAGRCLCCLELGQHSQAQGLAEEAGRLPVDPWDQGRLSWLRAKIARQLGNRAGALELSLELVRRVRAKIEHERDRKDARARKAWRTLAVRPTRSASATVP